MPTNQHLPTHDTMTAILFYSWLCFDVKHTNFEETIPSTPMVRVSVDTKNPGIKYPYEQDGGISPAFEIKEPIGSWWSHQFITAVIRSCVCQRNSQDCTCALAGLFFNTEHEKPHLWDCSCWFVICYLNVSVANSFRIFQDFPIHVDIIWF